MPDQPTPDRDAATVRNDQPPPPRQLVGEALIDNVTVYGHEEDE